MGLTSLRTAVVLFVIVPCVLAISLIGWAGLRGLEEQINARMQDDLELIARTLRLPLSEALARGQPGVIQDTIEWTVGMDRVYAVHVYDEDGERVAQSGQRVAAVPTAEAAAIAGQRERREGMAELGEEQLVSVFQPLIDEGGRIRGLLQVTRHSGAVQDYLERVRRMALLGIAAVGLLFTGVIVLGHQLAVGRQLAQQRATEASLREQLHRSEKMAAIGRLAAGVAHELGSPLATLYGHAQQLLRRAPPDSAEEHGLRAIGAASQRMEQTIRQLMDFGRANPLHITQVPLRPLLERLAAEARERLEARHAVRSPEHEPASNPGCVEIEVAVEPTLTVQADALRLEQALRNLVGNAAQAAHSRVRIAANTTSDSVEISIGDDGPGVPKAEHARIFDPFYTTKPVGQGTGLGLSVATAVADDHGGRITLARDPLGGARFVLSLPKESRNG